MRRADLGGAILSGGMKMAEKPKFSQADLKLLHRIGVSENQIKHLEHALLYVRMFIGKRPKRSETIEHLKEIERLASQLSRKLGALVSNPEPEYGYAHTLLEPHYWDNVVRQHDEGPTASHHLIPRLDAIAGAAKAGRADVPAGQTRQSVADPRAIQWIKDALLDGWIVDQNVEEGRALPPYPSEWTVSKGEQTPFRRVAGLCFRVAGGNGNPIRAIEAYMAINRRNWNELYAAFEDGEEAATEGG